MPNVMAHFGGGAGGLTTSALALGIALRSCRLLTQQAQVRTELAAPAQRLNFEFEQLRHELLQQAAGETSTTMMSATDLRQAANLLACRSAQAVMAASKGAGFVRGHAAERTVREAQFFLVWSCPQAVLAGMLSELVR